MVAVHVCLDILADPTQTQNAGEGLPFLVGNTAETTLKSMGIACQKVRHPSYGGKTMFINGINEVINTLSNTDADDKILA